MIPDSLRTVPTTTQADPHEQFVHDVTQTQIEIWLLEIRAKDVRRQLDQARTRRAGLGREYRRSRVTPPAVPAES